MQRKTPVWMRACAGHAFYRRGAVEASLPVAIWHEWERRGWSYHGPDRDSVDFHNWTFAEVMGLRFLFQPMPTREVLRWYPSRVTRVAKFEPWATVTSWSPRVRGSRWV